jgi:hypothetical protein
VPARVGKNRGGRAVDGWGRLAQYKCASNEFDSNSNFKRIQIHSNFDYSKKDLPIIENFDLKYGCEVFEERNHFFHWNFSRFAMDFN